MPLRLVPDVSLMQNKYFQWIVYSPLCGIVSVVNAPLLLLLKQYRNDLESLPEEVKEQLRLTGILTDKDLVPRIPEMTPFRPTRVTLFITSDCNLRCVYCYARAGETPAKELDPRIAFKAIDLVAQNAVRLGQKTFGIGFHGGGEPTKNWKTLQACVMYGKELSKVQRIELTTAMSSNGIYSEKQIDWLIEHFGHISLSWDGPPSIQDLNRPLANGNSSSAYLERTAKRFIKAKKNFSVRATITGRSVTRMREIYDYLGSMGIRRMAFEPEYECGRCVTSGDTAPTPDEFVDNFIPLISQAKKDGIQLTNSFGDLDSFRMRFCGAAGSNFCVTPEGDVSACFEITDQSDPRSGIFFYGKYDLSSDRFIINEEKRQVLHSRHVQNLEACQDCAAKWVCAGDCLAKSVNDLFRTCKSDNARCIIRNKISPKKLELLISGGG